jgi:hypothetical protein
MTNELLIGKTVGPTGVGFSGGNFRGTQVCIHGGNFSARQIGLWWRAVEALERFASVREPEPSPWPLSTILFSFLTCTLTLASIPAKARGLLTLRL